MQSATFLRFTKLAIWAWLAILSLVLVNGLWSGASAGGEIAMQMFVLTFPVSIAVGVALNATSFFSPSANGSVHVLLVWLPFFFWGLIQAGIIIFVIKFLANKRLNNHSILSPTIGERQVNLHEW